MRAVVPILALALLVAPALHAETVPVGRPFLIGVGETVEVGETALLVHFDAVLSDSRCPMVAFCFWEGEATAGLKLDTPEVEEAAVELHTPYSPFGDSQTDFAGYVVSLLSVSPYPRDFDPIPPDEYRLQLLVEQSPTVPARPASWSTLKAGFH